VVISLDKEDLGRLTQGRRERAFQFRAQRLNVNPDNHRHLARHHRSFLWPQQQQQLAAAASTADALLAPKRTSEIFFSLEFSSIPPYCDFQQQDRFIMVKVWFPSMFMRLVNHNLAKQKATLQVPPSMTKHEVKEYLSKIYNIEATKVSTVNVAGKMRNFTV
jgi:hypothetical protein